MSCLGKKNEAKIIGNIYVYQASCQILKTSVQIACIEYSTSFLTDTFSNCTTQPGLYSSYGATNSTHYSGTSAPACSETNLAGRCTLSNRRIFFYANEFSLGEAQTECNTLNGTLE